jgi:hypothetical protein
MEKILHFSWRVKKWKNCVLIALNEHVHHYAEMRTHMERIYNVAGVVAFAAIIDFIFVTTMSIATRLVAP